MWCSFAAASASRRKPPYGLRGQTRGRWTRIFSATRLFNERWLRPRRRLPIHASSQLSDNLEVSETLGHTIHFTDHGLGATRARREQLRYSGGAVHRTVRCNRLLDAGVTIPGPSFLHHQQPACVEGPSRRDFCTATRRIVSPALGLQHSGDQILVRCNAPHAMAAVPMLRREFVNHATPSRADWWPRGAGSSGRRYRQAPAR